MTTKLHAARVILAEGLYLGMMGREPDDAGLDFWAPHLVRDVENAATMPGVYGEFLRSPEFHARWAALQMPVGPAITAFVSSAGRLLRAGLGSTTGEATVYAQRALDWIDASKFDAHAVAEFRALLDHIRPARQIGLPPALDRDLEALWKKHRAVLANGGIRDEDWR